MDNLNDLGKVLNRTNKGINSSLRRIFPQKPITHVVRDIFDSKIPFEMEFETDDPRTYSLGLFFQVPPPSDCSGTCFVGICEYFQGTGTILTTTYEYITNSVIIYRNDIITTNYTKTGVSEITLGFTPSGSEAIKVCYVYSSLDDSDCIPSPCFTLDDFNRVVSTGWGTNNLGNYSYINIDNTPPNGNAASVADFGEGAVGKLIWDSGSPLIFFGPNGASGGTDVGPWQESHWTFKMLFKTGDWPYGGGGPHNGYATIVLKTNAREVDLVTGVNIGHSHPHGQILLDSTNIDFDWHPNQWYSVNWFYDAVSGDSKVKVWETFFESEPEDWTLAESLGAGDSPVEWMRVGGGIKNSSWDDASPYIVYFDDLNFCDTP